MTSVVLDANLLLLFVVGTADRRLVGKHRRLSAYDETHFDGLVDLLASFDAVVVTPHSLAEFWNLMGERRRPGDRDHEAIQACALSMVASAVEIHHPATDLITWREIGWLGLSDVAQIAAAGERGATLLSADGPLCHAAGLTGVEAISFWRIVDPTL